MDSKVELTELQEERREERMLNKQRTTSGETDNTTGRLHETGLNAAEGDVEQGTWSKE